MVEVFINLISSLSKVLYSYLEGSIFWSQVFISFRGIVYLGASLVASRFTSV